MWMGSVPWPYRTAGTLWARRMRRAAPLPNSVRNSAVSLTSGTNELLRNLRWLTFSGLARRTPSVQHGNELWLVSLVDDGTRPSPRQLAHLSPPLPARGNPVRRPRLLRSGVGRPMRTPALQQ